MALPETIEIVPLDKPVRAEITVPGSKSITNRALILAALADGEVTLAGALWSEDTQVMAEALQKLGSEIKVEPDPEEFCNRTITVKGLGGNIPNGGTAEKPLELFVGNAGTAARFLAAFVCLGNGVYRLSGVPRMHERPQAALFEALRGLGYLVESEKANDKLPAKIFGSSSRGNEAPCEKSGIRNPKSEIDQSLLTSAATKEKKCRVSIAESSQFASALLLCAKTGGWKVEVVGENAEESPYVAMTAKMIEAFPHHGGKFQIEPDASSGSYFAAVNWVLWAGTHSLESDVTVKNWPTTDWQIDSRYLELITGIRSKTEISRKHDLGDSIMLDIVISPLNLPRPAATTSGLFLPDSKRTTPRPAKMVFRDLDRLRVQETDRVEAIVTELKKLGTNISETNNVITIIPDCALHLPAGQHIETYNDHRVAMCFAVLGLKVPGIKIKNPACVKKTFPNFFQKFATPPPKGLGATIRDAKTGRKLAVEELFAE